MHRVLPGLLLLILGALGCNREPARPSLVLVVIDTLRADHVGAYGYPRPTTPRLDELAARGARFSAAHASTSWTLPSVVSMLTGTYPAEHGVDMADASLNEKRATITTVLQAAGYETAAFSANVAFVTDAQGIAHGFDHFETVVPAGEDPFNGGAGADRVTDAALAWLGSRTKPRVPYFLYVHYFDPHGPYHPPKEYAARLGVAPDEPMYADPGRTTPAMLGNVPGEQDLATLRALYDGEIAFTDAEVGRLLDGLRGAAGDGPIVAVTADHGEEFGDHGGMQHGRTLFEELLHVPLLVFGGSAPGLVVETPVSLISLAATFADYAGVVPAPAFVGSSLVPVLRGQPMAPTMLFADLSTPTGQHRVAAIDGSWKLVLDRGFAPSLFDLGTDPHEAVSRHQTEKSKTMALQKAASAHNKTSFKARGTAPPVKNTIDAARGSRLRALGYIQ